MSKIFLLFIFVTMLGLVSADTQWGYCNDNLPNNENGCIPAPTINYSLIPTVNSSAYCVCWTTAEGVKCNVADITYDEISGGDVNALGYTGTFSFLSGNVGGIDMSGDPWWLSGTNLELERELTVNGYSHLNNTYPLATLTYDLGSGALRWRYLWVQNISAENINAYNLHLTNNLTIDGLINGVNISNLSNAYWTTDTNQNSLIGNKNGSFNLTTTGYGQFAWVDKLAQTVGTTTIPPNNTLRLYVENFKGFSVYKYQDSGGMIRELVRDSVFVVKRVASANVSMMTAVYACASTGDEVPVICLAKASNISWMPVIGITIENITSGSYGRLMQVGLLENVNTASWSTGDILYLSPTTFGGLTNVQPVTPNLTQEIGTVLVSSATIGKIQVLIKSVTGNEFGTINNYIVQGNLSSLGTYNSFTNINIAGTQSAININATNAITAIAGAGNNGSNGGGFNFTGGAGGGVTSGYGGKGGGFIITTGTGGSAGASPYGGAGGDIELTTGAGAITQPFGNIVMVKNGGKVSIGNMNITSLSELFTVAGNINLIKNNKLILGNSTNSSSVYYDGGNMQINPANNGSGLLNIAGEMTVAQPTSGTGYKNQNVFKVTGGTAGNFDYANGSHIILTAGSANGVNSVGTGGNVTITAGGMSAQTTGGVGGKLNLFGGTAVANVFGATAKGGDVYITAGAGANAFVTDGSGGDIFIDGGGNAGGTGAVGNIYLAKSGGNVMIGNTTTPVYPLEVYGNGSTVITGWFKGNVSATGFITRTSIFDTTRGDSFSFIKNSTAYLDRTGKINESVFYGYTSWKTTDYSRPVIIERSWTNETTGKTFYGNETTYPYTITNEGVELGSEIDVLRQAVFELNLKNTLLENRTLALENENARIKNCTSSSKDFATYKLCVVGVSP
jgi:hypothetical protein